MPDLALDVPLAAALLWVAWRSLTTPDLFKAVVLFITYGLLMALAWVRLGAPDIALAEAAIGAGLTGALLLDAAGQMDRSVEERPRPAIVTVAALLAVAITAALGAAVLALPAAPPGLGDTVRAALPAAGVEQPVTAVLLNFRGYDTWLELGVLLLAVIALLALRRAPDLRDLPLRVPDALLASLTSVLAPLMVLAGGYLLWLGTHAAGGAFQAGALLGGAGVLLRLSGWRSVDALGSTLLKTAAASGFAAFLVTGAVLLAAGRTLLHYPPGLAYGLILFIEIAATVGIACTLATLFAGAPPRAARER